MRRRSGFTLLEVLIALALISVVVTAATSWMGHMFRMTRQMDAKKRLAELAQYVRLHADCAATLGTYVSPSGSPSPCRFNSDRAVIKKKDGSTLLSETEDTPYNGYLVRARCDTNGRIFVEYKNGPTLQNVPGQDPHPDWRPLARDLPSLCDATASAETAVWGNVAASTALTSDPPLTSKDPTASITGTFSQTGAFCASEGSTSKRYYTGFANCPSGYSIYHARVSCGASGFIVTGTPTQSGLFAVCCGDADRIVLGCARDYTIQPPAHDVPPAEAAKKNKPPQYNGEVMRFRMAMFNSYANCRGPNPSVAYNAFGAYAPCPPGTYAREMAISCGSDATHLVALQIQATNAAGACCSSPAGYVDMTCGVARFQMLQVPDANNSPDRGTASAPAAPK